MQHEKQIKPNLGCKNNFKHDIFAASKNFKLFFSFIKFYSKSRKDQFFVYRICLKLRKD